MKFGDKLIKLRKQHGLSQEELAEKLNVSRQSVSKWESNNTYPETDKIVQICNIFDCTMDDLINDKISEIEKRESLAKKKYQIIVDSFLDFIVKTVNLFTSMKFLDIIKCLFELGMIAIILMIAEVILDATFSFIMRNLFDFIHGDMRYYIQNFSTGIIFLIWFIISIIIIIHVFKIRYLDYYDDYMQKSPQNSKTISLKETKKEDFRKREKVIIRDDKDTTLAFLTILSKIVVGIVKIFAIFFLVIGIFILFGLVVSLILTLSLVIYSDLFKGISLGLFGLIALGSIIIYLLGSFILKKKIAVKTTIICSILAFLITSIATGITILSFKDIEFQTSSSFVNKQKYIENIPYTDKMYINNHYDDEVKYLIDNTKGNMIEISAYYDEAFNTIKLKQDDYFEMNSYNLHNYQNTKLKDIYKRFIKDLNNNVITDYMALNITDFTVTASEEVINKLLDNYGKVYLYEKTPIDNGYLIKMAESRVILHNNNCLIDYDIYNDKFSVLDNDCVCEKELLSTSRGDKTIYSCRYTE